ncbi:DUF4105 domain-containing protein [Ectothiorhodospiraceae bacterium 2226]|nr:DUF4105 domain-containing protein [Ectothiorhodospiraceae bacterium 2226]
MRTFFRTISGALLLLAAASAGAGQAHPSEPFSAPFAADVLSALASHPQWLQLLHYDRHGRRSEIVSDAFFLSPAGRHDPEAELRATLRALTDTEALHDDHPRCQFPARYFWLSRHLDLPGYRVREPACARFERWAQLDDIRSASLLMVSGYFGNPASAFGHTLLKFNSERPHGGGSLLDLTFNFGALVPDNELTPVYIYRGLTGGYQAGFSDRHYYTQDLVYARTEFRDMWDYEIALDDDALQLLVFHLWEMTGRKFTYYFLTQNCAYRLGELMTLATGEPFVDGVRGWYAPIELFHRLHTLDERAPAPLIRAIRYMPSSQRAFYHQFRALAPAESGAAGAAIAGAPLDEALAPLTTEQRIEVVDALLAYYEYRGVAQEDEALRGARRELLAARLRLPPRERAAAPVPARPSPALGSAPMALGAGVGWERDGGAYGRLQWSAFAYDLVGANGLEAGELVALDAALGVDRHGDGFLERLDLIRVRRLNPDPPPVPGESRLSWHVRVGAERHYRRGAPQTDPLINAGAGRAARLSRHAIGYLGVDLWGYTGPAAAAAEPTAAVLVEGGTWKAWLHGGARYDSADERWLATAGLRAGYRLAQHRALRLEVLHEHDTRALLSFNYYR